jgi:hypothetical protein
VAAASMTLSSAIKAQHFLDKIRNLRYIFQLEESLSRSSADGRGVRLLETLAHNLPREPGWREDFFIFSRATL